jgi:hypothetical protein
MEFVMHSVQTGCWIYRVFYLISTADKAGRRVNLTTHLTGIKKAWSHAFSPLHVVMACCII